MGYNGRGSLGGPNPLKMLPELGAESGSRQGTYNIGICTTYTSTCVHIGSSPCPNLASAHSRSPSSLPFFRVGLPAFSLRTFPEVTPLFTFEIVRLYTKVWQSI